MPFTAHASIDELLLELRAHLRRMLGEKLIGLYLYGSLVTGDFDPAISDIDLLAAISADLTPAEFNQLQGMHHEFARAHPHWDNRIEVAYLSQMGLQTFHTQDSPIAVISPGEPFNLKRAGREWLMNWWMVREMGVTVDGPPPETIIAPITTDEFVECIRSHALNWGEWMKDARSLGAQAYVILTLSRALYTMQHRTQVSKKRAAQWVQQRYPQWTELTERALRWRVAGENALEEPMEMFVETEKFVYFVMAEVDEAQ